MGIKNQLHSFVMAVSEYSARNPDLDLGKRWSIPAQIKAVNGLPDDINLIDKIREEVLATMEGDPMDQPRLCLEAIRNIREILGIQSA